MMMRGIHCPKQNPKTIVLLIFMICGSILFVAKPSFANPYDDCILHYMNTATEKTAVYAIERACISKSSVKIPYESNFSGAVSANLGTFNIGSGIADTYGLVIKFKNTTSFDITELNLLVRDRATAKDLVYTVKAFGGVLSVGTWISGPADPSLQQIIKSGETRDFFVHVDEFVKTPSEFAKKYEWYVIPTKGIPED